MATPNPTPPPNMIKKFGEKSVSEHASGLVHLAFVPVRFTVHTAGSAVTWLGSTLVKLDE